ncbi:MAG TPA: monofunctional biosynthetic peptidoglycan transglycosylase [Verrucomicrobiae bacterium]|nr:monofunctional biosynthetic peptidoglycan transglycosylase [Verrucomicrobiae bacterium]
MLRAIAWAAGLFIVAQIAVVLTLRWVDPPVTWTIWRAGVEARQAGGTVVRWRPVPLDRVASCARLAVIAAEDQEFARHRGFDEGAIRDAMEHNRKEAGRRLRGGSTISQQVAKNVFLWQGRTWLRKGLEAWFTALIEALWGKRRILEVYLNCAEMGRGIFGIEAAAQQYFRKSAAALNPEEAALIAAALPAPRAYLVAKPGPWLRQRQRWVLGQMRNLADDADIKALVEPDRH